MATHNISPPCADVTGTPDLPSPEAELPVRHNSLAEWADNAVRVIYGHPGVVLGAAAVAGFVVGLVVKRLLSNHAGGRHERNAAGE